MKTPTDPWTQIELLDEAIYRIEERLEIMTEGTDKAPTTEQQGIAVAEAIETVKNLNNAVRPTSFR